MLSELAALGICVCFVVLGAHLVLSVLTALGLCVMFCATWSAPGAVSACCTWHMLCFVLLGAHLVLSVLAALGICVMFCGAWSAPGAVSACCTWHMCIYMYVLWCLECSWCCQSLLHLAYVYVL